MATLQDILSGNFPAARRYAEGYAQMPSYLQDPYLGLSTSQVGNVTKGLLSKTQFEKAQELASKNAETLLGLPKGNTAMDRAKAMGYDIENPVYRGTTENEVALKPSTGHEHGVSGISTTFDPRYASTHGDVVMPLLSKKVNVIDYNDAINQFENTTGKSFYDSSEKQLTNFLKKNNIGASILDDPFAGLDIRYLNPTDLRSKFAAFDPAKANEPNLLSAAMAFPISGLLEQPKDKKKKK